MDSSSGDESISSASLCFARLIFAGLVSSGAVVVRSLLEMLSCARARNDDDFCSDCSGFWGDPDRGVDCADEFVDIDSALSFFCTAMGAGATAAPGGLPVGGFFCSLPLLPVLCRRPSEVLGRSMGEFSSDVGDSRSVSPDNLPLVLLASSPLPFLSFRLNKPLSMPGFLSFLLPLPGFGSFSSNSRLGPRSSELFPFVEPLESSRRMLGVSVIFRVSMLSSLKNESVLRGVPCFDCF